MKQTLLLISILVVWTMNLSSQSIDDSFFSKVSYIGAFDGVNDWTAGWTEWDPVNANYPATITNKGNGVFTRSGGHHISANETWNGVIKLDGWVYVDAGATLTIQPGTIIRGTNKSVLVIERGGKINAAGTVSQPIVFTSTQGTGFRSNSDWGGLVICGKAPNNLPGVGEGVAEGGIGSPYGGSDPADSSGVLKYVRIEFPGYEVFTASEVNGLTLCSVGNKTVIDCIQVSHSGDDGYEWFGGTVNAKHIISYKTEDDDFDTDNGYSGMVQFALSRRDASLVDTDTANGFESDNDAGGTENNPKTAAYFSNVTACGPAKDLTAYNALPTNHKEGAGMRLRRNTRLKIYNSVFLGYGRGLRVESAGSQNATASDALTVKNTFIAGVYGDKFRTDDAVMSKTQLEAWFLAPARKNQVLTNANDLKLNDPFNTIAPNFNPGLGSPAFYASCWYSSEEAASINHPFFDKVSYVGAFSGTDNWTAGWTEWDPVNANYPATVTNKGNGVFTRSGGLHITANETWSGVIKLDGWVYVDAGATLTIQPGTIVRGTNKSVLVIERGGMINATGTKTNPIVFTSNQGSGFRANSDWGGLVICGKAPNNLPGVGEGVAEGGIGSPYGGSDPMDNSGILAYVRIEFPGYEVFTASEVNGLTLCSVGNKTIIDYIQVSHSGDDGYEWFGGTVNAKHIISYKTEDDDFDTDNGYSGMVQFAISRRDAYLVDTDTANGFESDNDSGGTENNPKTAAYFSNVTACGPAKDLFDYNILPTNHKEGAGMRLRRNTRLKIYNSVFLGYGRGLRVESAGSQNATASDALTVKNTFIAGVYGDKFRTDDAVMSKTQLETWFLTPSRRNKVISTNEGVMLKDPYNTFPDFQPKSGSPVFNASCWVYPTSAPVQKLILNNLLKVYPNPVRGNSTIEFTLKNNAYVKAEIFNLSGSLMSVPYEGILLQGTQKIGFTTNGLTSGIYLAKILVDKEIHSIKLIVE